MTQDRAGAGDLPEPPDELTGRVEAAMDALARRPLAEHPAAFEAMDADIRAALGAGTRA